MMLSSPLTGYVDTDSIPRRNSSPLDSWSRAGPDAGLGHRGYRRHHRPHRCPGRAGAAVPAHLALVCTAMGAGATSTSHVNDAGYWLVSRFFGINEKDTLKSWTALETIMGFTAFGVAALLSVL